MNNTNYDDYARDTSSSEGELTEYQQYILPALALPSELRVEDVLRPFGIETYIDESDYSNKCSSEHEFEDALSHFSQDQPHETLYDTDFDHNYPSEIPTSHSHLPQASTNSFSLSTQSKY
jgi:hypothetical protein